MMIITLTVENCHITEKKERKTNLVYQKVLLLVVFFC